MTLTRRDALILAAGAGAGAAGRPAHAQGDGAVDLLLVLAADASGSIDQEEFRLQREGYANAFRDDRVIRAMTDGPAGAIAVAFVEWGSPGGAATVVPWMRIAGRDSGAAFAAALIAADRSFQSFNAIGDALVQSAALIAASPFRATRSVIDLSGDGPDMRSRVPAPAARSAAVAAGITINALAIGPRQVGGLPLDEVYRRDVIGGPGAFVVPAESRSAFAAALFNKLIREVAGPAAGPTLS